jgi:hypothetical protein
VIEIGDHRLPDVPVLDQQLLAAARGQQHHFVRLMLTDGRRDVHSTQREVLRIGL